jgi:hypothetical protein
MRTNMFINKSIYIYIFTDMASIFIMYKYTLYLFATITSTAKQSHLRKHTEDKTLNKKFQNKIF